MKKKAAAAMGGESEGVVPRRRGSGYLQLIGKHVGGMTEEDKVRETSGKRNGAWGGWFVKSSAFAEGGCAPGAHAYTR